MSAEKSRGPDAKPTTIEEIDVTSVDDASKFLDRVGRLAQKPKFKSNVAIFQSLTLILSRIDSMLELEKTDQDRAVFLRSLLVLRNDLLGILSSGNMDKALIAKVQEALATLEEALRIEEPSASYFDDPNVVDELMKEIRTATDGVDPPRPAEE